MPPVTINTLIIEDLIELVERPIVYAKAEAFDLLMHRLRSEVWHARNPTQAPASEPASINLDGVEAVPQPAAEPIATPDADPFAPASPTEAQPQPRRAGRRSRRSEEGQPAGTDAQPSAEPQPVPEEGQPLTAEALGLTAEPAPQSAAQPLPLPVVEAPDVSAAPTSADDVYGTGPAEDPFA
jgi:hypothetical protein